MAAQAVTKIFQEKRLFTHIPDSYSDKCECVLPVLAGHFFFWSNYCSECITLGAPVS